MRGNQQILGYIVEPKNGGPIYLTFKQEVAEKRTKAGDFVTPYTSRNPDAHRPPQSTEDEGEL